MIVGQIFVLFTVVFLGGSQSSRCERPSSSLIHPHLHSSVTCNTVRPVLDLFIGGVSILARESLFCSAVPQITGRGQTMEDGRECLGIEGIGRRA